jgi:16S rRNA (guanine(966)-N(2))-methyltransferase RsmD
LFGGSGGLGIEALSRGMHKAIFVDRDSKAVQVIRQNVESCRLMERVEIYRNDAERALKALGKRDLYFDLVLLDPPYKDQKIVSLIDIIAQQGLLSEKGVIMVEHATEVKLPQEIGSLIRKKYENYGITAISIYEREGEGSKWQV